MRIEIVIFDGFDDLDALAPAEVLNIAAREGAPFDVELVGVRSPGLVQSAWKTQIFVENVLGKPDAVIIPGGGWVAKPAHGTWAQVQDGFLPRKLAEIAPGLQWAGSVSTGAMVLAAAGMLHGQAATASQGVLEELRAAGSFVVPQKVADDGDRITAAGLTSSLDLALWITDRFAGAEIAARTSVAIGYRPWDEVWTRGTAA